MRQCKKCQTQISDDQFYKGDTTCKSCIKVEYKIRYYQNKERKLETNKLWRDKNKERVKELVSNWYKTEKGKQCKKRGKKKRKNIEMRNYRKNSKEKLHNSYCKKSLSKKYDLSYKDISEEMVILERARIKSIRFVNKIATKK